MFCDVKIDLHRLEASVEAFEKEPVQKGLIMFYGDSGFTRWKPLYQHNRMEDDLPGKDGKQAVINHGFGTSTAEEQLFFYDRAVKPWAPRALVLKTFSNDAGSGYSADEILFLQARLMDYARRDLPGIRFYLCNAFPELRPQKATEERLSSLTEYNELVERYCAEHEDVTLVDLHNCPLFFSDPAHAGEAAYAREELFVEDKVHFNSDGYELFRQFFLEQLNDIL